MASFYVLPYDLREFNALKDIVSQSTQDTFSLICPLEILAATGPAYWLIKEKELYQIFPHKKIVFWYDGGDMAGFCLGALRMGVRHLVFRGSKKIFYKIKSIAHHYQATVIHLKTYHMVTLYDYTLASSPCKP
jgi:hypothetical protein